jgi:hypothetical protein
MVQITAGQEQALLQGAGGNNSALQVQLQTLVLYLCYGTMGAD